MKLFDFKFIIILGLSVVIYLIYKEVDALRTKIELIENKVFANTQPIEKENTICDIFVPLQKQQSDKKIISIDMKP